MRKILISVICILMVLSVTGCSSSKGIIERESGECWYLVEMPVGKDVYDIFNISDGGYASNVTYFGDDADGWFTYDKGAAYKVAEGGWVGANSKKFLYIPKEYSDPYDVFWYWWTIRSEDAMSFVDAKEYIPCMIY